MRNSAEKKSLTRLSGPGIEFKLYKMLKWKNAKDGEIIVNEVKLKEVVFMTCMKREYGFEKMVEKLVRRKKTPSEEELCTT